MTIKPPCLVFTIAAFEEFAIYCDNLSDALSKLPNIYLDKIQFTKHFARYSIDGNIMTALRKNWNKLHWIAPLADELSSIIKLDQEFPDNVLVCAKTVAEFITLADKFSVDDIISCRQLAKEWNIKISEYSEGE